MNWNEDVRGVLFDFAGTLVDGHLNILESRKKAVVLLKKRGYDVGLNAYSKAMESALDLLRVRRTSSLETPYSSVITRTLYQLTINPDESLVRSIEDSDFTCYVWHLRLGVKRAIVSLHRDVMVGIVSNSWTDSVNRVLMESGLAECFDVVVLSKDFGYRKPDRRIFLHAAKLLGLQPAQVVYVGDSYADDVLGPLAAGMTPIWKGLAVGVDLTDIPLSLRRMLP